MSDNRVGFWFDYGIDYAGGLNYMRNLLYAISMVQNKTFEPVIFFGSKTDIVIVKQFEPYAKVILTPVLERGTVPWFIHKCMYRLFGSQIVVNNVMSRHDISIISHSYYYNTRKYPSITWIPDFQYLHLPEFFPGLNIKLKTRNLQKLIKQSDAVVLSSYAALEDFETIAPPECISRGRVLQFVSQPPESLIEGGNKVTRETLEKKYGFNGKFFMLPNQFWAHKNHRVVFEAVKHLQEKGKNVLVLCTGDMSDGRFKDNSYVDNLVNFINKNNLRSNIKLLGTIEYIDVLYLIKYSVALLNPSYFEGWSSSVEEAKSIGKQTVLSDIKIHREQNPYNAKFFNPNNAVGLSSILENLWEKTDNFSFKPEEICKGLKMRTIEFGEKYVSIVNELLEKNA